MSKEQWKDVVGYEGYYKVSNLGRVKSLDRTSLRSDGKIYNTKGRILKTVLSEGRYLIVTLHKDAKQTTPRVHLLVAKAHIPNPENLPIINHEDGDGTNNDARNLKWGTQAYNVQHGYDSGLNKNRGKGHYKTLLTEKQVMKICELLDESDLTQKEIGEKFGVQRLVINSIHNGRTWNSLTGRKDGG